MDTSRLVVLETDAREKHLTGCQVRILASVERAGGELARPVKSVAGGSKDMLAVFSATSESFV